ncbi:hypothetical protein PIIN_10273 [Serendipita indica DSM 11827]|uniref:Uncharacterized protein n=1 Tax=Serendipita indica (strain DSM 11827) TaxID=1109443 RepID=G4TY85_SERID|nr:hypothetical protein PIIN_10273 [Serendipita indica DSM 11827]
MRPRINGINTCLDNDTSAYIDVITGGLNQS